MQTAILTADWQVTIPKPIRKKLNLKTGDKLLFLENDHTVFIENSSVAAIEKLQSAMEGETERAGIFNDDDVLTLCRDVREELYEKQYADNA